MLRTEESETMGMQVGGIYMKTAYIGSEVVFDGWEGTFLLMGR